MSPGLVQSAGGRVDARTRRAAVKRLGVLPLLALSGCSFWSGGATGPEGELPKLRLENGEVAVELDVRYGGAITFLAGPDGENLVNVHDPGRLIQATLYDGREFYPHSDPGAPVWPWNPVPGGDRTNVSSGALAWSREDGRIFVRSRPREWNGSGRSDVLYEVEVTLEGPAVRYAWRFINLGGRWRWARAQELPAIYTTRALDRVVGYEGAAPWTDAPVKETPLVAAEHVFTEGWMALVERSGRGLGVWSPRGDAHFRSFVAGGAASSPAAWETGYAGVFGIGDLPPHATREGVVYLIPGDWRAARRWIEERARPLPRGWDFRDPAAPRWSFAGFEGEAEPDSVDGVWRLAWGGGPADAYPPPVGWRAQLGDTLVLTAAFSGDPVPVSIRYWKHEDTAWREGCEAPLQPIFDGVLRSYAVPLGNSPCYRDGWVRQLALRLEAGAGDSGGLVLAALRLDR